MGRLAPQIVRLLNAVAFSSPSWCDNVRLLDSIPVPCGQSREVVKRSDFAGRAAYGYCASHNGISHLGVGRVDAAVRALSGPARGRRRGGPGAVVILTGVFGAWRSLVARTVRVGEVPGSNPGAPIGDQSSSSSRSYSISATRRPIAAPSSERSEPSWNWTARIMKTAPVKRWASTSA